MNIDELLYLSRPPHRLGGKDRIWDNALHIYNENHKEKIKLICQSHYRKVRDYIYVNHEFDLNYYRPGPSGLSQSAKDEIRQIIRDELKKALTVTVSNIKLPKDSIRYR